MHDLAHTRRSGVHRTRFPWTPVWANEGGRPEGIGDESGEGWPRGGRDGGGGANGRGATRAVECASEGRDRAAALEGRGAGHGVAGDAGAGARARAVAADLPRGWDQRVQAAGHAGGGARAQAGAGEGRRADDEARDRGVVPGKKRLRGGVAEVEALRGAVSPGTHERYPVTLLCEALHAPRSSVYAAGVATSPADGGKRGPKTALTDDELVVEIRAVLAACPFHSEGHRKVHFRLRAKEIRVGRKRVLRLMRAHHLPAPSRPRHEHGEPECNGCAERFMRTLKEQCLYLHQFRDLEEARQIIGAFIERYNAEWIVERLGYRTPAQARRDALQEAA